MLSFIGVVPNFMAAFLILGIIGLLGIPLDMMTITIAAITIGIAVDNSIHYIYRFKKSLKNKNYKTLDICHSTVGAAIINTNYYRFWFRYLCFQILFLRFILEFLLVSQCYWQCCQCLHSFLD